MTFLASGRSGWAAVCRLVSATHLAGERGTPVCTLELVAEHVAGRRRPGAARPGLRAGPGGHAAPRRPRRGAVLRRWLDLVGPEQLRRRGGLPPAARVGPGLLAARRPDGRPGPLGGPGSPVVLSNAVRFADRLDAPTTDVLDAARRLVPMDLRHLDRRNAEGFLKSGKQMDEVAEEICRYAGLARERRGATDLLAQHPRGRRPVRPRPARRPRHRGGALPGVRGRR